MSSTLVRKPGSGIHTELHWELTRHHSYGWDMFDSI